MGRLWGRKALREMGRRGQQGQGSRPWSPGSLGQESDFTVTVMRWWQGYSGEWMRRSCTLIRSVGPLAGEWVGREATADTGRPVRGRINNKAAWGSDPGSAIYLLEERS